MSRDRRGAGRSLSLNLRLPSGPLVTHSAPYSRPYRRPKVEEGDRKEE